MPIPLSINFSVAEESSAVSSTSTAVSGGLYRNALSRKAANIFFRNSASAMILHGSSLVICSLLKKFGVFRAVAFEYVHVAANYRQRRAQFVRHVINETLLP